MRIIIGVEVLASSYVFGWWQQSIFAGLWLFTAWVIVLNLLDLYFRKD